MLSDFSISSHVKKQFNKTEKLELTVFNILKLSYIKSFTRGTEYAEKEIQIVNDH